MKIVVKDKNESRINRFLDSILYILGYILVLFIVDALFNSFDVDNFWYEILVVLIIYILNKTIKPVIVRITIPITAITFGLFYPFINLFILKVVDLILGDHFNIYGFFSSLLISVCISIMNFLVEELIVKPIIRRCNNE